MIDEKKLLAILCELGKNTQQHVKAEERNSEETMLEFALKNQLAILHDVIGKIKEQPKIEDWIPCSERLPEPETVVLFTNKNGQVGIGRLSEAGNWYISDSDGRFLVSVIAWMPLPEPYKE